MEKSFSAYQGDGPYVFVCYAHDDEALVYPEISRLRQAGFHIWYDEGVSPGSEWSESLAKHIQHCSVFLYFVTPRSVEREHCRREVNFALDQSCSILVVHLEETEVPPALQLNLSHRQAILKYEHSKKVYEEKLDQALAEIGPADAQGPYVRTVVSNQVGDTTQTNLSWRQLVTGTTGVIAVALLVTAMWWLNGIDSDDTAPAFVQEESRPPTIAVLPLKNVSGEEDQDYFGEAISSEILAKLARVDGLRVISMTSSTAYRDSELDVREIGRRLTADFIIEGSAMRSGNLARVNVHLTESSGGTELWGTSYTKSLDDMNTLFALYDAISGEIGHNLPPHIRGTTVLDQPTSPPTDNIAAYNLFQEGVYEWHRTGDPRKALQMTERALTLEPDSAFFQSEVAPWHYLIAEFGFGPAREHLMEAEAAIERALTLDPDLGNTHVYKGLLYDRLDLDFHKAMDSFERGKALGADSAELASAMQDTLLNAGLYQQGLDLVSEEAAKDPESEGWPALMGRFLHRLHREEEAREHFEKGLRLGPRNITTLLIVTNYFLRVGDIDRAEEILKENILSVPEIQSSPIAKLISARISLARGDLAPLSNLVAQWIANRQTEYVRALYISNVLYELGDYEGHIRWFAIRVEERDGVGWFMDNLRDWPDYWDRLQEWVLADPKKTRDRLELVNEHRALVEKVTEKMVL